MPGSGTAEGAAAELPPATMTSAPPNTTLPPAGEAKSDAAPAHRQARSVGYAVGVLDHQRAGVHEGPAGVAVGAAEDQHAGVVQAQEPAPGVSSLMSPLKVSVELAVGATLRLPARMMGAEITCVPPCTIMCRRAAAVVHRQGVGAGCRDAESRRGREIRIAQHQRADRHRNVEHNAHQGRRGVVQDRHVAGFGRRRVGAPRADRPVAGAGCPGRRSAHRRARQLQRVGGVLQGACQRGIRNAVKVDRGKAAAEHVRSVRNQLLSGRRGAGQVERAAEGVVDGEVVGRQEAADRQVYRAGSATVSKSIDCGPMLASSVPPVITTSESGAKALGAPALSTPALIVVGKL